MKFLYFLEGLRNPVLDFIFSLITHLGEETLFLVIAIFIFWCVDKRGGYYVLMTGLIGTVINQWLKIVCRIPRPWALDPSFKPVESAFAEAGGYSFPSGHTISAFEAATALALNHKKPGIAALILAGIIAFSRLYLYVHYVTDVLVSVGLGIGFAFLASWLVKKGYALYEAKKAAN